VHAIWKGRRKKGGVKTYFIPGTWKGRGLKKTGRRKSTNGKYPKSFGASSGQRVHDGTEKGGQQEKKRGGGTGESLPSIIAGGGGERGGKKRKRNF